MAIDKGVYRLFAIIWGLVFITGTSFSQSETGIDIIWKDDKASSVSIPVSLFAEEIDETILKRFLKVRLNGEQADILGSTGLWKDEVIFIPMWSFTVGMNYDVLWRDKVIESFTVIPENESISPRVLAAYPSSDTLPENLLKFYIEFSAPMNAGHAYDHIHMLKSGVEVENVFLTLQNELWNEDQTLLTIWLDPGRIKRDLQPNQALGQPLKGGDIYQLEIDTNWKGVNGNHLYEGYSRSFKVSEADRIKPNQQDWEFNIPSFGSVEPLIIDFSESMDYVLAQNTIQVLTINDTYVPGTIEILDQERKWKFEPESAWISAEYKFIIESRLEDLAGNNLERLFDRDLKEGGDPTPVAGNAIELVFQIKAEGESNQ